MGTEGSLKYGTNPGSNAYAPEYSIRYAYGMRAFPGLEMRNVVNCNKVCHHTAYSDTWAVIVRNIQNRVLPYQVVRVWYESN
jgi:hypothetical protein